MEYCWAITFISLNNWSTRTYICDKWLWLCISPIMEKIVINKPMHVSLQLCPTQCDPMDCSTPNSFVHGILQARILEWIAMLSSRVSSQPTDGTCVSYVSYFGRWVLTTSATWEAHLKNMKTLIWKYIWNHMFITALFTRVKTWKQPKFSSMGGWIKKMWDNMAGPWGYYAKWNKSEREREILYDFTHM